MMKKKAKDIMTPASKVITIDTEETIRTAVERLATNHISGLPVVHSGKVVGVLSDSDIARFMHLENVAALGDLERAAKRKVADAMTKGVIWVHPDSDFEEILRIMVESEVNRAIVANEQMELLGLITRSDIIRYALRRPA